MSEEVKSKNGQQLSWPMLALILLTGGTNLLTTHQGNVQISDEQREGLRQLRDLHSELDDFRKWQRQAGENQQQLIQNDSRLLNEIHEIAVRLDRLKTQDQMRGAPN